MRLLGALLFASMLGCGEPVAGGTDVDAAAGTHCVPSTDAGVPPPPVQTQVSHGRLLRRVSLVLHGRPPLDEERARLAAAPTDEARDQIIESAIDRGLQSPDFYERMVDFGHDWMRNGAFLTGAQGDGYWGNMSAHVSSCPSSTLHAGAYYILAESNARGRDSCDVGDAPRRTVEPWWAPGTTVELVGDAAGVAAEVEGSDGRPRDCGQMTGGYYNLANAPGCGCGPHAAWCYPGAGLRVGRDTGTHQRREMWDEPARLVGHLVWHDRPLSDIVLGNYTVATNRVRAWYLRFGRETGLYPRLDEDTDWFRPDVGDAPRDPLHPDPGDPDAWRELVPETLAPQLLSLSGGARSADPARTLRWDPRTDEGPAPGLPMAGVMTMPGMMSSFPRERPRASRFLEIFACRDFDPPPADQHFPPVGDDLATSGECMHCHAQMDPVAMAFRRWIFRGSYVELPVLADLANLPVPTDLYDPDREYTYGQWFKSGADRWEQNWLPETTMTPITAEELARDPRTMFLDTIPTDYVLFGQHPDGTMGPLAFAKVLVASGEFDRCAVRRLYARVVGRELDPARESRYIAALATTFADGDRLVRPFIGHLLRSEDVRRGL